MISLPMSRLLLRAAKAKSLGEVLCLGRQHVEIPREGLIERAQEEGLELTGDLPAVCDDHALFRALGARSLQSLDRSGYEGADIVADLNEAIVPEFDGKFDYIVDGGTFDHLFNLPAAFANVVRMLKEHGRIIHWNAASNYTGMAYLKYSADIFYDYYMSNGFASCTCHLAVCDLAEMHEPLELHRWTGHNGLFRTPRSVMIIVEAQKSPAASWNRIPTQQYYRDESLPQGQNVPPFQMVEILR